ncbi:RND family efflux transporter, MFP subunit [Halopseudomonas litoralis]|uniref:RND family efflux transporter, MFP subunit n=1 Tax=Halopseudomonas litoralis TaxID=797277 RepID=A0A1H1MTX4_9GAMM|nr:HlyD family secretion protein [Halopseudomonas litoralis]SDR90160.1 RND family efflux transporter, MFP subunit [Halopseudomonas litoralis]
MSRITLARLSKKVVTAVAAIAAVFVLWQLYSYYTYAPQTRDGKIRADVVALAADVSGRIETVQVRDNQIVQRGDVLFTLDQVRLQNALDRATAAVASAKARQDSAVREWNRYSTLRDAVSQQERDNRQSAMEETQAQYQEAVANLELADINLERADVRAPVNGIVTNLSLRPGAYAVAGEPVMALVDSDSFHVAGYFEETKLKHIHVGDQATIHIVGEDQPLTGHVEGLSAGIDDRERTTASGTLLANVNPTFSWIRLAQRIPVRISIDTVPEGIELIAGRTVTVTLEGADDMLLTGDSPWEHREHHTRP